MTARLRAVLPGLGTIAFACVGIAIARFALSGRWIDLPVHATVEAVGGVLALAIGALLIWGRALYDEPALEIIAAGLLGQGILDLAHALSSPSPAFFWSRTLPTVLGGVVFALVWVGAMFAARGLRALRVGVPAVALIASIALLVWPHAWPAGFSSTGVYTTWAKLLNVGGGAAFLIAAVFFVRRHVRERTLASGVLAAHCLLFALAGLTFWIAALWDASWWAFHALRLLAYLVSLGFVLDILRRLAARRREHTSVEMSAQLEELMTLRQQLAARPDERT